MYDLSETIIAVSSPRAGARSIVRLTGPKTLEACRAVFCEPIVKQANGIVSGNVWIESDLQVPAQLYLFFAPHSYTGQTLAELHLAASDILVETLVARLLAWGLRPAGPGEFTARAYLNGKLDLSQAEAVNEVIAGSNRLQLAAAEELLRGRLRETTDAIRSALLECLSLIEAGLDFSEEDISFISHEEAADRLREIARKLQGLLAGSIRYESLMDLPAVGIAGAPNAGKSSLLNALLGQDRSIVAETARTTRDVLSGLWTTDRFSAVLFDCAGLLVAPEGPLDELAQRAAIEALGHCQVVLFCVDATKGDLKDDLLVRELFEPRKQLYVATKCDLPAPQALTRAVRRLSEAFGAAFVPVSARTGDGLGELERRVVPATVQPEQEGPGMIAMTSRHKQIVSEAIENVEQAAAEIRDGREEVAAMIIRTAAEALADIRQQPIDEQILDHIFGRFCIGK